MVRKSLSSSALTIMGATCGLVGWFRQERGPRKPVSPRGSFSSMPDARRFGHADVHRRQDFVPFFHGSEGGKGARRSSASKKRTLTCGVPWPPGGFGRRIWLRSFVREPGAAGLRGTNRVRAHASSGEERLRRRRTIDAPRRGACGARTSGTRTRPCVRRRTSGGRRAGIDGTSGRT